MSSLNDFRTTAEQMYKFKKIFCFKMTCINVLVDALMGVVLKDAGNKSSPTSLMAKTRYIHTYHVTSIL